MGANQSSAAGDASSHSTSREHGAKTDYYELLGVDRQASDDEIKKAYRKKALEFHPDRNYGNVEETTRLFADVQSAYEVLSDPQERAWYDSHRSAILNSTDGPMEEHFEHDVRVTTADDILRIISRFDSNTRFTDSPTGFYGALRANFETLAREEGMASNWLDLDVDDYPSFGSADDNYEDVVRPFYAAWNGFSTRKTFSWKDVYRYSNAPDRRVRRVMEKENKRFRDEGIHEFNDAVRSLVAFVRKRDPRVKKNLQSEAERQKTLRDAAEAQAVRSRMANQKKLAEFVPVPGWERSDHSEESQENSSDEDIVQEEFECVVCNKTFKSEKQYEAHERSKKHLKAVQQLSFTMRRKEMALNADEQSQKAPASGDTTPGDEPGQAYTTPDGELERGLDSPRTGTPAESTESTEEEAPSSNPRAETAYDAASLTESSSDDEYASREKVEKRLLGRVSPAPSIQDDPLKNDLDDATSMLAQQSLEKGSSLAPPAKQGKAKEKRAKKAANKATQNHQNHSTDSEFVCVACHAGFPSKTRLFNHIKDLGHALPLTDKPKGGKGKKR